jgi:hypothetical protein
MRLFVHNIFLVGALCRKDLTHSLPGILPEMSQNWWESRKNN